MKIEIYKRTVSGLLLWPPTFAKTLVPIAIDKDEWNSPLSSKSNKDIRTYKVVQSNLEREGIRVSNYPHKEVCYQIHWLFWILQITKSFTIIWTDYEPHALDDILHKK